MKSRKILQKIPTYSVNFVPILYNLEYHSELVTKAASQIEPATLQLKIPVLRKPSEKLRDLRNISPYDG